MLDRSLKIMHDVDVLNWTILVIYLFNLYALDLYTLDVRQTWINQQNQITTNNLINHNHNHKHICKAP